jgi:CheY-like chemotaxis protein
MIKHQAGTTGEPMRETPAAGCAPRGFSPGGPETILVVEDDPLVRNLVLNLLQRHAYRVIAVETPAEALRLVATGEFDPDLLLTDVVMPKMNGRELYDRLAPLRPRLKVIFMSGYTDVLLAHQGILTNDTPLLQKPFTVEELLRFVRQVLDADLQAGDGGLASNEAESSESPR